MICFHEYVKTKETQRRQLLYNRVVTIEDFQKDTG